jgi:hypothetical protein
LGTSDPGLRALDQPKMDKLPVELVDSMLQEYEKISNTLYESYTNLLDGKRNDENLTVITAQLEQLETRIEPADESCTCEYARESLFR